MHRFIRGSSRLALSLALVAFAGLLLGGCADDGRDGRNGFNGSNGEDGLDGQDGAPGPTVINASTVSDEVLASLDVDSEILGITIASPPVVTFRLTTSTGVPIIGIVPFWEDSNRYVRFTLAKLMPGEGRDPDAWVCYTRNDDGDPSYDTGSSFVDNGDGTYTFTFETDVTTIAAIPYDPTLTHRVAGQLGSSSVPLEPQNFWNDFVPNGGPLPLTKNVAVMETCNECHDDLVFHGRRFLVEYCVNCHNPDLAEGEGNMSFMIHKIHDAGTFEILDDAIDYSYVTYPQDMLNCRKCHNADIEATVDGGNWMNEPSIAACSGCHEHEELSASHGGSAECSACHDDGIAPSIETAHLTENATPNNPFLPTGQRSITYELLDAVVDGSNNVTVTFKILSDGTPIDVTNLPTDLAGPERFPGLLLAWAQPQGDLDEPMDYNNFGMRGAQPISLGLDDFSPIASEEALGTISYNGTTGVNTVVIEDGDSQFPEGATLRAVGLQGYFQQDIGDDTASLHTPSGVVAVSGDDMRREIVDNNACMDCHEWFEGHGGNRVMNMNICTLCHVPNQSSSGRTITDPSDGLLADFEDAEDHDMLDPDVDPNNPLTYPEDAQNFKDLIHGIHSADDRTRSYTHVRGGRQGYYDWSHISFPRGASTSNCMLCHKSGSYELPLADGLLPTTVRTTGATDGQDQSIADAETAFQGVPNDTDWINSPAASSCFYCHTSPDAKNHMEQNGGLLSAPKGPFMSRDKGYLIAESCSVCHGPGTIADLDAVHNK